MKLYQKAFPTQQPLITFPGFISDKLRKEFENNNIIVWAKNDLYRIFPNLSKALNFENNYHHKMELI